MSITRPLTHAALLLWAGLMAVMLAGCATLGARAPDQPTTAYADAQATALARIANASLVAAGADVVAPSGLRLLPRGEFAFDARIAMARHAERSIDAQYYHLQNDQAGRALLRALHDAAARGVRVRLLVDDFHAAEVQDLLLDLSTQEHMQVRLFNPLPLRKGSPTLRLLLSPGSFELHNHRMHNKLFVADNALAIFGGRNIADEYFMSHPEANFVDLDVLAAGPVVRDLSAVFDDYWNSEFAWPVQAVLGTQADTGMARTRFDTAVRDAAPPQTKDPTDPLGQTSVSAQLDTGWLALVPASARVFADPPSKAAELNPAMGRPSVAMLGLLGAMAQARHEVGIMSPYFVPGPVGMQMMRAAAQQGIRTVLYTNSLASSDEPLVHQRYAGYRVEMLRFGVQINEFSPALVQRSRGFGFTGPSMARLHAKVSVVDDKLLVLGSVNLDPRSAIGNTEMSVVIDSPALVAGMLRLSAEKSQAALMYRLRLQADGQTIEWLSRDERGQVVATTDEPGSTPGLRLQLWLQSLLVGEHLL